MLIGTFVVLTNQQRACTKVHKYGELRNMSQWGIDSPDLPVAGLCRHPSRYIVVYSAAAIVDASALQLQHSHRLSNRYIDIPESL